MDLSSCHRGVEINRILFGFETGILVDLVLVLTDKYGNTVARCSLEITLPQKDYLISDLKSAAMVEALAVLKALIAPRSTS
jgi:hypothetical protein